MGSKKTKLASGSGRHVSAKRVSTKKNSAAKKGKGFWENLPPLKRALIVLGSVLALAGILAALIWTSLTSAIRPPDITLPSAAPSATAPNISTEPGSNATTSPDGSVSVDTTRKEGFYTILVMGQNYGLTDVMMVVGFDTENGSIQVINIPRDTYSNDIASYPHKINSAYNEGGMDQVYTAVEGVVGFRPDKYALIDYDGFVALIDTLEGVAFNVPRDMYHVADNGKVDINLKKGYQTLNGRQALGLVRYREGYADQDLGRIRTAQQFLVAAAKKMVDTISFGKISDYVSICIDYLDTDLTAGEIIWFAQKAFSVDMDNDLDFHTPTLDAYTYKGAAYVFLHEEQMVELVNSTVNPYLRDMTADDLDIFNPNVGVNTVVGSTTDSDNVTTGKPPSSSSNSGSGSARTSSEPTAEPTTEPTAQPSSRPSSSPSTSPSRRPSSEPSESPDDEPTDEPTEEPTDEPVDDPSDDPADEPIEEPSDAPSEEPNDEPSEEPTPEPSTEPSEEPFTPATPEP